MKLPNKLFSTLLITTSLFSASQTYSQKNLVDGYILTLTGDTVKGKIDYQEWHSNPQNISFISGGSGEEEKFYPKQIKGFGVSGDSYASAEVELFVNPVEKPDKSDNDPNPETKKGILFLRALVEGPKCLYVYRTSDGIYNFYIKTGTFFELLIYKKYFIKKEENDIPSENRRFVAQLSDYFKATPDLIQNIASTGYSAKSLNSLFVSYYKANEENPVFQPKIEKAKTSVSLFAGMSLTKIGFPDYIIKDTLRYDYLIEGDITSSKDITGGIALNITLPRRLNKLSICNELTYSSYLVNGHLMIYPNTPEHYYFSIGSNFIRLNNIVRYAKPLNKIRLFFNFGISSGYAFNVTNTKQFILNNGKVIEGKAVQEMLKFEQGLIAGAGIRANRLSLETRFTLSNGMSSISASCLNSRVCSFLLSYTFD